MSDLQSIIKVHSAVAAEVGLKVADGNGLEVRSGQVKARGALDHGTLQDCLDQFKPTGGWLQYQGQVVRPQDFTFTDGVPAEHPDWGMLLDAELFGPGDRPSSLAIRFDGEHWRASEWRPGDGEEWLAEPIKRRGLGGIRLQYLRLWQEKDVELRAASAWLVGTENAVPGEEQ